jgi:hypothetical protein
MAKTVTTKNGFAPKGSSKKRPGIHSKTKTSKLKSSKLYRKSYKGQG